MKVSIFSLWRDAGEGIFEKLGVLEGLEKYYPDVKFEYFFYENDSKDETPENLSNWLDNREGKLLSEKLDYPKFPSIISFARFLRMTEYRNKMLRLGGSLSSEYSLVWDSDIEFKPDILEKYLQIKRDDWVMLAPNIRQNIPCKMQPLDGNIEDSYYDVIALFSKEKVMSMFFSDCPLFEPEDRRKWFNDEPVEVDSAFGGIVLVKSKALGEVTWGSNGGVEHLLWCNRLSGYGKIYVMPNIRPSVTITEELVEQVEEDHPRDGKLIFHQLEVLRASAWERKLALNHLRTLEEKKGQHKATLFTCASIATALRELGLCN